MKHELAKTLTLALVNYIDENRPEGTMDCSSGECERLEKAFEFNNLNFVEGFMEKKLSRLSEFEKGLVTFYNKRSEIPSDKDGVYNKHELEEFLHESAKTLLAIAKEELVDDMQLQVDDEVNDAYYRGRSEALKDLPVWRIWRNGAAGNSDGHPIALVSGAGGIRFVSALGITGEKYIMLDDLKKLPGFKED